MTAPERVRPEDRITPLGGELRIDATLGVVLVGFRLLGAAWLTILAVLSLTGRTEVREWVVWSTVALAWIWTGVTVYVLQRRPLLLLDARFIVPDLLVALVILAAPLFDNAEAINFSGGFPASSVLIWAYVWGYRGGLIAALAACAVIVASDEYSTDGKITTGLVYLAIGLVVPWGVDLLRRNERSRLAAEEALAAERAERVRIEERAEVATRVHDSVLQTLAMIQRRAGDADEVRTMARRQERELRDALFGDPAGDLEGSFSAAVKDVAARVEAEHAVTIDVVTVGDRQLDGNLVALIRAGREAMTNAAKFSGVNQISAYSEVTPQRVALFIRDRGKGFDATAVAVDRRGIAESIVGRMERYGGTARIVSIPGQGTEVELVMEGASGDR